MCQEIFFRTVNQMTSLKTFLWQTSNYFRMLKGHIFWGPVFADVRNSRQQGCSVREKETFLQRFFQIFEILEHHFLSERSQNVCVVQSGSKL